MLSAPLSITALINRIARGPDRDPLYIPSGAWYPSQIGGCPRSAVLKHAGIETNPMSDETARRFWLGNLVHSGVQTGLSGVGLPARLNIEFKHELPIVGVIKGRDQYGEFEARISGRLDTLRLMPEEVIELKTVKSRAFDYPLPQPDHVLQTQCYLAFPPVGYSPQVGRLVYISKDGDKIAEYLIQKDQQMIDEVVNRIVKLEVLYRHWLASGDLPPALPKVPLVMKGKVVLYKRNSKYGQAGHAKLVNDHRVLYCDFRGTGKCCGD